MSACADASCQYTLTTVPLSHTRSRANAWSSLVRSAPSPSLCLLSTLTAHPLADRGCDAPPLASHTASSWVRAILVFCASCALSSGNISSPDARTHSCVRTSHVCTRVPTRLSLYALLPLLQSLHGRCDPSSMGRPRSQRVTRASRALIRAMLAVETCATSQIHVSPLDARTPVRTSHVGTHVPTRLSRYLRYNHCDTTAVPRSFVCTAAREEGKPSCAHLPLRTPPPRPAERTNGAWHRGLVEVSISFSRVPRFVRSARSARFRRSQRDGQTARALAHSHRFRPRDPPQRRPPTEPWAPPSLSIP